MTANVFHNIFEIESSLRDAADPRCTNPRLTTSDFYMLALGIIFLRQDLLRPRLVNGELAV